MTNPQTARVNFFTNPMPDAYNGLVEYLKREDM